MYFNYSVIIIIIALVVTLTYNSCRFSGYLCRMALGGPFDVYADLVSKAGQHWGHFVPALSPLVVNNERTKGHSLVTITSFYRTSTTPELGINSLTLSLRHTYGIIITYFRATPYLCSYINIVGINSMIVIIDIAFITIVLSASVSSTSIITVVIIFWINRFLD